MTDWVVDTNVLVVANARNTNPSISCQLASIEFLKSILEGNHRFLLDLGGHIVSEYKTYCNPNGSPGIGDRFLLEILNSHPNKVQRLELDQIDDQYVDFPVDERLQDFDPSDRKFVALAKQANATIANATDTDWLSVEVALRDYGVEIHFVCGTDCKHWFKA
jgi:hypothetical protein